MPSFAPHTVQHLRYSMHCVLKCLNEFAECGFQRLFVDVPSLTQGVKEYP